MKANEVRADCSSVNVVEIRSRPGKHRVYFLVENRSFFTIFVSFDSPAPSNGTQGVELLSGQKYELFGEFAPENETIFLTGSVITQQQVNYSEGYYEDYFTGYDVRDHS